MIDFSWILLALSVVVLMSYLFDLISRRYRIPSVVMLIATGAAIRMGTDFMGWNLPFLHVILPILGTLGLILIVLEGALELRLSRHAKGLFLRSALTAIAGIGLSGWLIAAVFHAYFNIGWLHAWILATPFGVISSAVAIPAAAALSSEQREYVVYESALSDIFGVLLFYALLDAQRGVAGAIVNVVTGIGLSTLIGAGLGLVIVVLTQRIEAHVRFVPMIFGLVSVYAGSSLLGLAPLVSVLAVGLLLNNIALFMHLPGMHTLVPHRLEADVINFKQLTAEMTFVVRTFFFVLLGYWTTFSDLALPLAWQVTAFVLLAVFLCRFAVLGPIAGKESRPLLWFAPRGLITVVLFLNIPAALRIPEFPEGALMLTVLTSIMLMTAGMIFHRPKALAPAIDLHAPPT